MWSIANLLRLSHSAACADVSDLARSSATTYADGYEQGGELVELADRLVRDAEYVRLLAVAAERARGVSWETIGEGLGGVSKQAAQKRFAERVGELVTDVLLPHRQGPPGALGWTAGPDAAANPDTTLQSLDAWAKRHHEATDGGKEHVDELVSHGLRARPREAIARIGTVTRLTELLMEATGAFPTRELPSGVTERYARRRLLEEKVALYAAMQRAAQNDPTGIRSATAADAHEQAARAFEELVELLVEEARDALAIDWRDDEEAVIGWHGRAVAVLAHSDDPVDGEVRGWWLWGVDDAGQADDRGGAWPQLVDEDLDVDREHLEHAAINAIAAWIGSDQAKGVGPFDAAGIAGREATA